MLSSDEDELYAWLTPGASVVRCRSLHVYGTFDIYAGDSGSAGLVMI